MWAGERVVDAVRPVGPPPVQPGGPQLLVGTLGPRTIRAAAAWADGLAGMSLDLDLAEMAKLFTLARDAWREAGRPGAAVDDVVLVRARRRRRIGPRPGAPTPAPLHELDPRSTSTRWPRPPGSPGPPAELADVLKRVADLGCDEVQLIPTGSDVAQVHRVAELLA